MTTLRQKAWAFLQRPVSTLWGAPVIPPAAALPNRSAVLDSRADNEVADIYDFTLTIIDKKYDLYEWTHNKLNTIITIDGFVIGGMLALHTSATFKLRPGTFSLVVFDWALVFLAFAIGIALWNTNPRMDAGIGNLQFRNLRQVASTETFGGQEFLDAISALDKREMVVQNVNQIKGMNRIIWKNQAEVRHVTFLSLIGLALMVLWVIYEIA